MNKIKYNEWLQTYEVIVSRSGEEGEPDYKTLAELYDDSTNVIHRVARRSSTQVRPVELYDKVVEYGGNPASVLSPNLLQSLPSKGDVLNQLEGAWLAFVSQQGRWAQRQKWSSREVPMGIEEAARMCFPVVGDITELRSKDSSAWATYTRVLATARETLVSLRPCTFAPSVAIARETLKNYLEHLEDMTLAKPRLAYVKAKACRVELVVRMGDFFDGTLRDVFVWSGDVDGRGWEYDAGDFHYTGEVLFVENNLVVVSPFAVAKAKE